MKGIFLKIGMLLISYSILISLHLKNSNYYILKKFEDYAYYKEDLKRIPLNKPFKAEQYEMALLSFPFISQYTEVKNLPFEDSNQLILTVIALLGITMAIITFDLKSLKHIKSVAVLTFILLGFLFLSSKTSGIDTQNIVINKFKEQVSTVEDDVRDNSHRVSELDDRVSDLEY